MTEKYQTLTIPQPDDWHIHLREGDILDNIVLFSAKQMARAIVMPNLKIPVTNIHKAYEYYKNIKKNLPKNNKFQPLMTLYLTENTTVKQIEEIKTSNIVKACKLYPKGATTNSNNGVTNIKNIYPLFEKMSELKIPLLIHAEVNNKNIDVFDREKVFIEKILTKICFNFPEMKIVVEHITTKEAVDFVYESSKFIGSTITAHHLLENRNSMFDGGIKPDYYCLPILKKRYHQLALAKAATSGNPKFFYRHRFSTSYSR